MIVILKRGVSRKMSQSLVDRLERRGLRVEFIEGSAQTVLCLIGDTTGLNAETLRTLDIVDSVKQVSDPFRSSSRRNHPDDTVVQVGNVRIGGGHFAMIAGPCSVESEAQLMAAARAVKAAGAQLLRGGAFKPRTSPYDFQGLREDGLRLLKLARQETGLPIVTEIPDAEHLPLFEDVDLIQIGARNMQNYELLRALSRLRKPVLLKRGRANTLEELLMSAEYLLSGGNTQVILCERGIRTFSDYTRSTLDLSAVPALHELTHLPVIVDPSHAAGRASLVEPLALAAAACGSDGLMIEVHADPAQALCDGAQALRPEQYAALAEKVRRIRESLR